MNQINDAPEPIDHRRRQFFGTAALALAAGQLGMIGSAGAQTKSDQLPAIKPGTNTSFGPLKQIDAGTLNVGYAEAGPSNGAPVILLHGWPYDIYSFVDVTPLLASAGYRVIVLICAVTARHGFSRATRRATASRQWWPRISLP
jgi:hypothetical protein